MQSIKKSIKIANINSNDSILHPKHIEDTVNNITKDHVLSHVLFCLMST